MIVTRTPLRISLCGGGTDIPEFYEKHPGAVISFSINKYVYVSVNEKFDGKLRVSYSKTENVDNVHLLRHDLVRETLKSFKIYSGVEITSVSDIPGEGSGLGSSSAFTVGLIKAMTAEVLTPMQIAERAYYIERERCHHPVGKQDQYASAFGGLNYIVFRKDGFTDVYSIKAHRWNPTADLNSWLLLLWTGKTRNANEILANQSVRLKEDNGIARAMSDITESLLGKMTDIIDARNLGGYLHSAWHLKRRMTPEVSNEYIDSIYHAGMAAGAYGGKLCGAGGGGFMLFVAEPDDHERITRATGLRRVPFKITHQGSEIIYGGRPE
jgi:D-glycero-alpha-D-manno-heptose-7-phosphate kinase